MKIATDCSAEVLYVYLADMHIEALYWSACVGKVESHENRGFDMCYNCTVASM